MSKVVSLPLAHFKLTFRSCDRDGFWFGLGFPDAVRAKDRGPLASGPVPDDLPAQLRVLADYVEGVQNGGG